MCARCASCLFFFFFQAEDGIRDIGVTGVQTCALPISPAGATVAGRVARRGPLGLGAHGARPGSLGPARRAARQIGRESCRERGEISVVAVSLKKKKKY